MDLHDLGLRGRVAIVTGGSRGIGRAVVELLAACGSNVVVNYLRDEAAANAVVSSAQVKGIEALAVRADVSKLVEVEHLITATLDHFRQVDILVCSAGIWEGNAIDQMSEELWARTIEINLTGTWTVCKAVVAHMKARRTGRIVIISSTAGQRGEANFSNYAASKAGQIAFTKSLAAELGPWGITVNAVAPGWVDTEMTRHVLADGEEREAIDKTIPLGKVATPGEIAGPVVFLCSDWARYITGEVVNVNGGSVLCG